MMRFTYPDAEHAYIVVDAFDRGSYVRIEPERQRIVGYTTRNEDIVVNVCKKKHVTNMRSAASDEALRLVTPRHLSLEEMLEFLSEDEILEVTPKNLRMRKITMNNSQRMKEIFRNKT